MSAGGMILIALGAGVILTGAFAGAYRYMGDMAGERYLSDDIGRACGLPVAGIRACRSLEATAVIRYQIREKWLA